MSTFLLSDFDRSHCHSGPGLSMAIEQTEDEIVQEIRRLKGKMQFLVKLVLFTSSYLV